MFKPLIWEQEKENYYKSIVDVSSGAFRNHITYRVFLHKNEYWRVMISGSFAGLNELEKSTTKEEAMEKAEKDYQKNLMDLENALNNLKILPICTMQRKERKE